MTCKLLNFVPCRNRSYRRLVYVLKVQKAARPACIFTKIRFMVCRIRCKFSLASGSARRRIAVSPGWIHYMSIFTRNFGFFSSGWHFARFGHPQGSWTKKRSYSGFSTFTMAILSWEIGNYEVFDSRILLRFFGVLLHAILSSLTLRSKILELPLSWGRTWCWDRLLILEIHWLNRRYDWEEEYTV